MEVEIGDHIAHRIISCLPKTAQVHKPFQALTKEEVSSLKSVLYNKTSGLLLRDRAILTIAMYTGLRNSDIANLKF